MKDNGFPSLPPLDLPKTTARFKLFFGVVALVNVLLVALGAAIVFFVLSAITGCAQPLPDTAADIGPVTVLEGEMRGVMHDQYLEQPAVQLNGLEDGRMSFLDVVTIKGDTYYMSRIYLGHSLLEPIEGTVDYDTEAVNRTVAPALVGALGCSGGEVGAWDVDTEATSGYLSETQLPNGDIRLDYGFEMARDGGFVTGTVDYRINESP